MSPVETPVEEKDLFMICRSLNRAALSGLPHGYHIRPLRRDELELWKAMPFDAAADLPANLAYMTRYFENVYGAKEDLFFQRCLFLCDQEDRPLGTCFAWEAYGCVTTIHWFKILPDYEGAGLGRALLSAVMREIPAARYPVYLHTHPGSLRALKLYSDFGFALLTDPRIGHRQNGLTESLPWLQQRLPAEVFNRLRFESAPPDFLEAVLTSPINEF